MLPLVVMFPAAVSNTAPAVAVIPELVICPALLTSAEPNVPLTSRLVPLNGVLLIITAPVVLTAMVLAWVVSAPTLPLPLVRFNSAPITVPVDVMLPAFVAVKVTDVGPVRLAPMLMVPLPADVEIKLLVVVDETTPVVVTLPAVDRDNAPAVVVSPLVERFWFEVNANEPAVPETARFAPLNTVFVIVVAPVLLIVIALAVVFKLPTAPEPPTMLTVGPDTEPADCVMVPAFVEVSVTVPAVVVTLPPRPRAPAPADVEVS